MKIILIGMALAVTIALSNSNTLEQCGKQYNECSAASINGTAVENDKLGTHYYRRGNYGRAVAYHKKACSLGYAPGCNHAGYIYDQGLGTRQNYPVARKYFSLACNYGSSIGCSNLGEIYEKGQGITQSDQKAQDYYQRSCDLGSKEGCINLDTLKRYRILVK